MGEDGVATPEASAPMAEEVASPAGTPMREESSGDRQSNEATIESYDIYFDPDRIIIPADTDIPLTLPNLGATLHNFSIDELEISVDIEPSATETTTIHAPAGRYAFYCNVPGHKEAGMAGVLIVR
jgi:plastocyanin